MKSMALIEQFLMVIMFILQMVFVKGQIHNKGTRDYCLLDKFNPQCKENEVIIINSALFGRMKNNPCISKDIGQMGCYADVKEILQGFCGGRRTCDVVLSGPALLSTRPCGGNYNLYITVSYSCLQVHGASSQKCSGTAPPISSDTGYLASTVAIETKKGTSQCPWKIKSKSGQQLNITIQRFANIASQNKGSNPPVCHSAASVRESTIVKNVLLCPSDAKNKSVYISKGDQIELVFAEDQALSGAAYLIHYQAVGCKNPVVPKGTSFERKGNSVAVHCNNSKVSWELHCKDNEWEGEEKTCSEGWAFASSMTSDDTPPMGMLLIVVTGIALGVLIGGFLLYLAINAFKRYHGLLPAQQIQNPSYEKPFYNPNKMAYNDRTIQRSSMIYGTNRRSYPNRQMLPPVPPPHADNAQMRPPSEISEANRQSHIYETPLFNSL